MNTAPENSMPLTDLMWPATANHGLRILEEYQLIWRDWARAVIKLPVEWSDFYVVNALVIVLGIAAAHLADLLGAGGLIGSPVLGTLPMASPVVLLQIKDRPYFREER
jgi:hypothetical protein